MCHAIDHHIHHHWRLVTARGSGTLTDQDVFTYQREVWSLPEVAGFDELIDMTAVERIAIVSVDRVWDLARLSAAMDAVGVVSRLAIVAPQDVAFGLGRMYEAYRISTTKVGNRSEFFGCRRTPGISWTRKGSSQRA